MQGNPPPQWAPWIDDPDPPARRRPTKEELDKLAEGAAQLLAKKRQKEAAKPKTTK